MKKFSFFVSGESNITFRESLHGKVDSNVLKKAIEKSVRRCKKNNIDLWVDDIFIEGKNVEIIFKGQKRGIFTSKKHIPAAITCFTYGCIWENPDEFVIAKREKMEEKYGCNFTPNIIDQMGNEESDKTFIIITMEKVNRD